MEAKGACISRRSWSRVPDIQERERRMVLEEELSDLARNILVRWVGWKLDHEGWEGKGYWETEQKGISLLWWFSKKGIWRALFRTLSQERGNTVILWWYTCTHARMRVHAHTTLLRSLSIVFSNTYLSNLTYHNWAHRFLIFSIVI